MKKNTTISNAEAKRIDEKSIKKWSQSEVMDFVFDFHEDDIEEFVEYCQTNALDENGKVVKVYNHRMAQKFVSERYIKPYRESIKETSLEYLMRRKNEAILLRDTNKAERLEKESNEANEGSKIVKMAS